LIDYEDYIMNNFAPFLKALAARYPDKSSFRNAELNEVANELGYSLSSIYDKMLDKNTDRISRGVWNLEAKVTPFRTKAMAEAVAPAPAPAMVSAIQSLSNDEVYIPDADPTYVTWGNFKDLRTILESRMFYPTFITGLSGNGKTMMVEQACAKLKREYVRVQITPETDEDDLIGGFRLINGETVFSKGPVIKAMEAGAILLIDEIDRSSNRLMALQGVLEGKPVMIKKTGEVVKPAPGFNVIATANTKGQGSDDGKFVSATIIDEAFLERFSITIEQPYPTSAIEKKIVLNHMDKYGRVDQDFAINLTTWSEIIRKTFADGGVDEIISTRRLCHIVQTFAIFNDKMKAIDLCINRFDEDTKEAFRDLYTKVDAGVEAPVAEDSEPAGTSVDDIVNEVF
jgi:hypothetical protein